MSPTEYQYEPLSSPSEIFRLLNILPPADDGTLSLSLRECAIATASDDYDALSYTWGGDSNMKEVLVDGRLMHLRENLWSFLNHCATTSLATKHHHNLWIDAICINQENDAEKGYQVKQMRKIYTQARSVIVWLGDASKQSRILHRYCKETDQVANLKNDEPISWSKWDDFLREDRRDEEGCADMVRLLSHPYWTRLWIVQEVSLAREASFIAGNCLVPLRFMAGIARENSFGSQLETLEEGVLSRSQSIQRIIEPRVEEKGFSLPQLVGKFHQSKCSILHDRVYSMLGLVEGGEKWEVDYNVPIEELFLKALELTQANMIDFPEVNDRTPADEAEYDCFIGLDSLADGLRISPDDVAKHASLREQVKKPCFLLPVSVVKVYEACHYESDPLTYEDGDFKTAACFTLHPCSNECVTEGFVPPGSHRKPPPCNECGRSIKTNALVEIALPSPQGRFRNQALPIIISERGMKMATNFRHSSDGNDPWSASFEIQPLPDQIERALSSELIRDHIDLRRGQSRAINVPVSFLTLVELRRHTMQPKRPENLVTSNYAISHDDGTLSHIITHVSEVGSVSQESCDKMKRARASEEKVRQERLAEREAYEQMNPVQKLVHNAQMLVLETAGDLLMKGIVG